MCYLEEAPINHQDRAIARIEDDLTWLAETGHHGPENLPPAFLALNSACVDIPWAEAAALRRGEVEALLPINGGATTSQVPSYALQQGLQTYFFYVASPGVRGRETKELWAPCDDLLRRLLRSLPPRLTLASWVSKMLITHAMGACGVPDPELSITDEARKVKFVRTADVTESYMQQARFRRLESDLKALPQLLAHLTVKFAEWLPFELQMLDDEETAEEVRMAFRNGDTEYLPGRRTPKFAGDDFFLYVSHAMDFLEARGWFDLPFATDLQDKFHESLDRYRSAPGE